MNERQRLGIPSLMRSKLFVPGARSELFGKAVASAADALSFDLEDSVPADRKREARDAVAHFLATDPNVHRKIVVVRVNAIGTLFFNEDLAAVAGAHADMINLPMIESADEVRSAAERLKALGATDIGLLINIETPCGLRHAAAIAAAHPSICGLQIGYADLLEPCGIDRMDTAALDHIRLTVRLASAEAGVPAYDGAFAAIAQHELFRAECERAYRLGFSGKSCIHPSQIELANTAFRPTAASLARAERIVAAAAEAALRGHGAVAVDGQMIDPPFVRRAEALIASARAYPAFEDTR